MANQNGLFTTRDVAGSGDPDSVFFLRKGNPLVIDDLICNNITCDEIDLNGGLLTTTTGGTILTLNGNPVGGGVATITGTIPINVTAGVNPVVSLNDSTVTPGTYTVASITVDSKGLITNASSGVIPPNDDWSNFPAQTNVNMNNFVINNLATPLVATDGATKGYVDTLDGNNVKLTGDQTISGIKTFNSVPVCATMPTNNDQLANKQYVDMAIGADTLANVLIAGNSAGANQINMNNNKIINCADPTLPQDVATKNYVDALPAETLTATLIAGNSAGANQIDMNSNKIINCADPTLPQDVATKIYVDTRPAESLSATLIAGNSAGANQIDMNNNKIVNCLNPTAPQDVATKDYVDSIAGVIPTLGQVLTAGNIASGDINMNDFDISSVNDITMSGLAPTITATNVLGNLTLSALGTFNALTGGQMTLASGGIMSIGGATYTTLENLRINNSVITKEPGQPDLSISDVATLNIVGSGNINFATDTLINNTTGVVKINSIAQATPALTNVLAYDPVSHEVKYQANSGGTVTGVTATTPILSSGGTAPVISHATSGVVPATYTNATVTVDATGHITSATNGTAPITTINGTSPIVANTVAGTTTVSHANSGVVAGSYTNANITVDATGHITTATNGTTPATPTLSQVLTAGNTSGANHIVMDVGQNVDVTGGEVFAGTLNVNVIEPLAPAISTDIGIVGSLVFPGPIEMRNNGAGGGIGLTIDSIPSGTTTNVLGYNTLTHQITYQPASTGSVTSVNAGTGISITGTPSDPIVNNTGVLAVAGTAGNISATTVAGTATIDLVNAGTAGTYAYPASVTTDTKGRVTAITAGTAPITTINGTSPIVANTVAGTTTVSHANSGVVAGAYTNANITIDATGHITLASNGTPGGGESLAQTLIIGNTSGASDILMDSGQKIDVETITSVQTITGSPITNGIQIKTLSSQRQLFMNDATNEARLTTTSGPNVTMEHYTESGPIPKSGIRYTNLPIGIDRRVEVGFDPSVGGYTKLQGIQQSIPPKEYVIGFDNVNERAFYQEAFNMNNQQIFGNFQIQTDITVPTSGREYKLLRNIGIDTPYVFNSLPDGNTSDIPFFRRDGLPYPGVPISVGSAPWSSYPSYPDANMEVKAMDTNPFDGSVYVGARSLTIGGSIIYQFFPDANVWNQIVYIDDTIQALFYDRESGNLYYGGKFSISEASPGSPVSTKMVGYYDGSINQLQTGLNDGVFTITRWNGYIAIGGAFKFDNTGSGAYFERFALYDINTNDFYTLGQTTGAGSGDYGFDADVLTLAVLPQTNTLVIGGEFSTGYFAGSPAFYPKLIQYDLLNGLNGVADNSLSGNRVVKLLADYEGKRLYILGDFITSEGDNFVATNINRLDKFINLSAGGIITQASIGSTLTKDEVGGYIWIFDNNNKQMWRYDPNALPPIAYEYMNSIFGLPDNLCFGFYSWFDKAVHFWFNIGDGYYRYFCDQRVKEALPGGAYFEIDGYRYNTVVLTKKGSTATIVGEAGNPVWGVVSKTPDVYFEWDTAQLRLVEPAYATALCLQTISGISGPVNIPWTTVKGRNIDNGGVGSGKLVVKQKGLYKMSYSVQLDNSSGGSIDVYIWFIVNGRKFQQTNTKFVLDGPNSESAPFVETFVELDVDDLVDIVVDSSSGTLDIPSTPATATQPAIPGVIFNIQLIQPSKEFYTTTV